MNQTLQHPVSVDHLLPVDLQHSQELIVVALSSPKTRAASVRSFRLLYHHQYKLGACNVNGS